MNTESKKIIAQIHERAKKINRPLRFMELCGTHSQAIALNGIKSLVPDNVKLITGPGCPVCVTDQSDIDIVVGLALNGIPVAVYGDTLNVPGNLMSLDEAKRKGADVTAVYDVNGAIELKKTKPNLVFFGLGFETTTPMTAWAIKNGLMVYSSHKLFPPAMSALLANKDIRVDGFIDPGHVSAILGTGIYDQFKVPQVIAGFTGMDVLLAVNMLLGQIIDGRIDVENEYTRVVKDGGNKIARDLINEVFEITDAKWRGLGTIPGSGLKIREKFKAQDAEYVYRDLIKKIQAEIKPKPSACKCGQVLQGLIEAKQCPLFGKVCTPERPQGACMVSVEGGCNIEYRYNYDR